VRKGDTKSSVIQGVWTACEMVGSYPQSRESAKMVVVNKKIFMFGGFAREPFNDLRHLVELENYSFKCFLYENKGEEGIRFPQKRFGHSLSVYKHYLVVFGGGGSYNVQAKTRLTLNDVKVFDTGKFQMNDITVANTWETDNFSPFEINGSIIEAPARRMHHAADIYGCILAVHGGFSTENK